MGDLKKIEDGRRNEDFFLELMEDKGDILLLSVKSYKGQVGTMMYAYGSDEVFISILDVVPEEKVKELIKDAKDMAGFIFRCCNGIDDDYYDEHDEGYSEKSLWERFKSWLRAEDVE